MSTEADLPTDRRDHATVTCPSCSAVNVLAAYDIGDGPEYACPNCEWCWGADGQDLTTAPIDALRQLAETINARRA